MAVSEVSIIIRCYNLAAYLPEAVESVLGQTYDNLDVLVVDDGSTDETPTVARRYGSRVRYVRCEHGGVSVAGNTGLSAAAGDSIVFLDADDWLLPQMVEQLVRRLDREPTVGAAQCGWIYTDESGRDMSWCVRGTPDSVGFSALAHGIPFPCNTVLVRRSLLLECGGFDRGLGACEDWDLWLRLVRGGVRFDVLTEPLAVVRMRAVSTSRDPRRALDEGLKVIKRAHAPDPRVAVPLPEYQNGCGCNGAAAAWHRRLGSVAIALTQRRVELAVSLVADAGPDVVGFLNPDHLVSFCHGLYYGFAVPFGQAVLWEKVGEPLMEFLLSLERTFTLPGLAAQTMFALAARVQPPRVSDLDSFRSACLLQHLAKRVTRRIFR